jgi:thiamine pyrophosphate-dependent acetolactate synthase large subunit-like protein
VHVIMGEHAAPPSGADVLLQCLVRHGVEVVFAYPGGAALPILQALTRVRSHIRTILPRHEQGGGFAASAYARSSGKVGVCVATSGPGATNLVTCLADAQRNAVPLVALTGQVNRRALGSDAFQEIPIVSLCRSITKHCWLVTKAADIPHVMHEALGVAVSDRPGPVLVDVPKDLQNERFVPDYGQMPEPLAWKLQQTALPEDDPEDLSAPEEVIASLWRLVRERDQWADTFLTTGVGAPRSWVQRGYRFPSARHWISTDSLGAIGFAMPAAMGVQAAHPGKQVVAVDEPESFLSNIQELACAFCEKLPVKVLLLSKGEGADLDCAAVARGFRAGAHTVTEAEDVATSLEVMLDHRGPYVLDVRLPVKVPTLTAVAADLALE